jgi:hypothetical protein
MSKIYTIDNIRNLYNNQSGDNITNNFIKSDIFVNKTDNRNIFSTTLFKIIGYNADGSIQINKLIL